MSAKSGRLTRHGPVPIGLGLSVFPKCISTVIIGRMYRPRRLTKPPLSVSQIRRWALAYFRRHGRWPTDMSGPVAGARGLSWNNIHAAFVHGGRGLPRKPSLAAFLDEAFPTARRSSRPSPLTYKQILKWADKHRLRTGRWPDRNSGPLLTDPREHWQAICVAIKQGHRGLPGNSTLVRILHKYRGVPLSGRAMRDRPPLTIRNIVKWAKEHRERTGMWPTALDGRVDGVPTERWSAINAALVGGARGLPGDTSLKKLLVKKVRAPEKPLKRMPLTIEQILEWADAFHHRKGIWPNATSGRIPGSGGESWSSVNGALHVAGRGLPEGFSLSTLLATKRGRVVGSKKPPLTIGQILDWADEHHERTGRWPTTDSGRIRNVDEIWSGINAALGQRRRGLKNGPKTLAQLLAKHRGRPYHKRRTLNGPRPKLVIAKIIRWARAHHGRKRRWPTAHSGRIFETKDDTWGAVNIALLHGGRGLDGGSSLSHLLDEFIPSSQRPNFHRPNLTHKQILAWARDYHWDKGVWPTLTAGPIPDTHGETWATVNNSLNKGTRGLRRESSLAQLLREHVGAAKGLLKPPLTKTRIIEWAREHRRKTGKWPTILVKGAVEGTDNTSWAAVDMALKLGKRGLDGGSSLSKLLRPVKGRFPRLKKPPLTSKLILEWADEHYARTDRWPMATSGIVEASPEPLHWTAVDSALFTGGRGLEGRSSLAKFLEKHREVELGKNAHRRYGPDGEPLEWMPPAPPLTLWEIRLWARAHYRRFGRWPRRIDGAIPDAPGESWSVVDAALKRGDRGLSGGSSLSKLVHRLGKPAALTPPRSRRPV